MKKEIENNIIKTKELDTIKDEKYNFINEIIKQNIGNLIDDFLKDNLGNKINKYITDSFVRKMVEAMNTSAEKIIKELEYIENNK